MKKYMLYALFIAANGAGYSVLSAHDKDDKSSDKSDKSSSKDSSKSSSSSSSDSSARSLVASAVQQAANTSGSIPSSASSSSSSSNLNVSAIAAAAQAAAGSSSTGSTSTTTSVSSTPDLATAETTLNQNLATYKAQGNTQAAAMTIQLFLTQYGSQLQASNPTLYTQLSGLLQQLQPGATT